MHLIHLSLSDPTVQREAEEKLGNHRDPLDLLIELEEELGCSLIEAVRRYRDIVREKRTFDAH